MDLTNDKDSIELLTNEIKNLQIVASKLHDGLSSAAENLLNVSKDIDMRLQRSSDTLDMEIRQLRESIQSLRFDCNNYQQTGTQIADAIKWATVERTKQSMTLANSFERMTDRLGTIESTFLMLQRSNMTQFHHGPQPIYSYQHPAQMVQQMHPDLNLPARYPYSDVSPNNHAHFMRLQGSGQGQFAFGRPPINSASFEVARPPTCLPDFQNASFDSIRASAKPSPSTSSLLNISAAAQSNLTPTTQVSAHVHTPPHIIPSKFALFNKQEPSNDTDSSRILAQHGGGDTFASLSSANKDGGFNSSRMIITDSALINLIPLYEDSNYVHSINGRISVNLADSTLALKDSNDKIFLTLNLVPYSLLVNGDLSRNSLGFSSGRHSFVLVFDTSGPVEKYLKALHPFICNPLPEKNVVGYSPLDNHHRTSHSSLKNSWVCEHCENKNSSSQLECSVCHIDRDDEYSSSDGDDGSGNDSNDGNDDYDYDDEDCSGESDFPHKGLPSRSIEKSYVSKTSKAPFDSSKSRDQSSSSASRFPTNTASSSFASLQSPNLSTIFSSSPSTAAAQQSKPMMSLFGQQQSNIKMGISLPNNTGDVNSQGKSTSSTFSGDEQSQPTEQKRSMDSSDDIRIKSCEDMTAESALNEKHRSHCLLQRFDDDNRKFKDVGQGTIKILIDQLGRRRIFFNLDTQRKLVCNHFITVQMKLLPYGSKGNAFTWIGKDFSEVPDGRVEKFVALFESPEDMQSFKTTFESCFQKERNKSHESASKLPVKVQLSKSSDQNTPDNTTSKSDNKPKISFGSKSNTINSDAVTTKAQAPTLLFGCTQFNKNNDAVTSSNFSMPLFRKLSLADEKNDSNNPRIPLFGQSSFSFANTSADKKETTLGVDSNKADEGSEKLLFADKFKGSGFSLTSLADQKCKTTTPLFGQHSDSSQRAVFGASKSLFTQQNKAIVEGDDGIIATQNDNANDQDNDPHFEPVIDMPKAVPVITGEEGLSEKFCAHAKLFRFSTDKSSGSGGWKERGQGTMKILADDEGRHRVLFRRDQVHKLVCNHYVSSEMKLLPHAQRENSFLWLCRDFSEDAKGKTEQFCIRFKSADNAKEFQSVFTQAISEAQKISPVASTASISASHGNGDYGVIDTALQDSQQSSPISLVKKSSQNGWKCSTCLVENVLTASTCVSCNSPKSYASNFEPNADSNIFASKSNQSNNDKTNLKPSFNPSSNSSPFLFNFSKSNQSNEFTNIFGSRNNNSETSTNVPASKPLFSYLHSSSSDEQKRIFGQDPFSFANTSADKKETTLGVDSNKADEGSEKLLFADKFKGSGFSLTSLADQKCKTTTPLFGQHSDSSQRAVFGASKSLFTQQNKAIVEGDDGIIATQNDNANDQDNDPHFEPVIDMPKAVPVVTGEEGLSEKFCAHAKLFRFSTDKSSGSGQWKERGQGTMKILADDEGRHRVLFRRDQVHKLVCNHYVSSEMKLLPHAQRENSFLWLCRDFSEDAKGKTEQFCIRFKSADSAKEFQSVFTQAISEAQKISPVASTASISASHGNGDYRVIDTALQDSQQSSPISLVKKSSQNGWKCSTCLVENVLTASTCVSCNSPKY
ncbi:hypothetical protein GJ496_009572 [Pomphorhynchus laevis]|nr:hypothetical protein GJ496_009572 [Pomphorhynchus laevis]